MPAASPDALIAYGWSARVAALFHSAASGSDRPGRVIRVERGAAAVVDSAGAEALYPTVATTAAATATAPAVGDWVVIAGRGLGAVLPRWSSLDRQDPDTGGVQTLPPTSTSSSSPCRATGPTSHAPSANCSSPGRAGPAPWSC